MATKGEDIKNNNKRIEHCIKNQERKGGLRGYGEEARQEKHVFT